MRRVRAGKRGRWISLLVAGVIGYLLGGWHAGSVASTGLTASQHVALRFPEANADATTENSAPETQTGTSSTTIAIKQARLALFSPQPMAPIASAAPAMSEPSARMQVAVAAPPLPAVEIAPAPVPKPVALAALPRSEPKAPAIPAVAPARQASRPAVLLSDAQIAGIKERLHLTYDQERMWPAVEAALRSIAYAKARLARRHGAPEPTQAAAIDPDSAEVQGLKSAAIPLIMSFSDEQKNEVRSLAHGMGLDNLASEF